MDDATDCREALVQLYPFLDGELDDALRARINQHLTDCPPCGRAFDFESELKAVVKDRCADRVPDALRSRIAAALDGAVGETSDLG